MSELPPLSASEQKALDELDMTPILGTVEERLQLAMHKAIEFMRQRNIARASEKMAWAEHAKVNAENERLRDDLAKEAGRLEMVTQERDECRRLLQFVCDHATRNAGSVDNPYTYIWQRDWDEFEEAAKAGGE